MSNTVAVETARGSHGTGFLLEQAGRVLLITAAHGFDDDPEQIVNLNLTDGDPLLSSMAMRRLNPSSDCADVAVLEFTVPVESRALPLPAINDGETFVGMPCAILGYPYGLDVTLAIKGDLDGPRRYPVTKSGVIGMFTTGDAILVDVFAPKGYSGGPVFANASPNMTDPRIIGMVLQTATVEMQGQHHPAGITVCVTAQRINEEISKALAG